MLNLENLTESHISLFRTCQGGSLLLLSDYLQHNYSINSFDHSDNWTILSEIEVSIKKKIEAVGVPLSEWNITINYGIKTGYNEAFIINENTKNIDIVVACTKPFL